MPVDPARLAEVPLFSDLTESERDQLARAAELKTADPGSVFAHEGASGYTFFVVLDGSVDVTRGETHLETLGPGSFFGEMAIVGEGRRNATVTAATPVELLVLFGTEFRKLEDRHPQVADGIRRKVAERAERNPL